MKQFSLTGLLRVRDLEKQLAAADLAEANRALNGVRAHRIDTLAALAETTVEITGAANLSAAAATRASSQGMLADLATLHELAAREVEDAASAHNAARAKALAIEKLSERHLEFEQVLELRREQSALDEIAIGGWRRGKGTPA